MLKKSFISAEDKDKVIKVLKAKKALLTHWIDAIDELTEAVVNDEDTDCYFDDIQIDDDGRNDYAYIIGCVDEDDNGISVFPNFRGQATLHKYADGNWG